MRLTCLLLALAVAGCGRHDPLSQADLSGRDPGKPAAMFPGVIDNGDGTIGARPKRGGE